MDGKPPPPPYWVVDLQTTTAPKVKSSGVPDPPGYSASKKSSSKSAAARRPSAASEDMDLLKLKKAWEVAFAPAKSIPMNAIMMYMSGNSLQIFSIMMVFMLFKTPLQALTQTNAALDRFVTERTRDKFLLVKAAYVATNLLALALGVYKVNAMGLLP